MGHRESWERAAAHGTREPWFPVVVIYEDEGLHEGSKIKT